MNGVCVAPELKYRLHNLAVPRVRLAHAETTVDAPVNRTNALPTFLATDSSIWSG